MTLEHGELITDYILQHKEKLNSLDLASVMKSLSDNWIYQEKQKQELLSYVMTRLHTFDFKECV
jgi:hypothetical protein